MVVTMKKSILRKVVNEVVKRCATLAKKVYIEIEKDEFIEDGYVAWVSCVNGYGSFTNLMITCYDDVLDVTYYDLHSCINSEPVRYHVLYTINELLK